MESIGIIVMVLRGCEDGVADVFEALEAEGLKPGAGIAKNVLRLNSNSSSK